MANEDRVPNSFFCDLVILAFQFLRKQHYVEGVQKARKTNREVTSPFNTSDNKNIIMDPISGLNIDERMLLQTVTRIHYEFNRIGKNTKKITRD